MYDEAYLEQLLEKMLHADEDITFRNVSRHSEGGFPFPTSLTRRPGLRRIVEQYVTRQTEARRLAGKLAKSSPAQTAARLAAAEARIADLSRQNTLLIAGLRGAILAIGRTGGIRAWKEFFPTYSAAFSELRNLGAVPDFEVVDFPTQEASTQAPLG